MAAAVAVPEAQMSTDREKEVEFAEFENRMRKFAIDLLEPTIRRVSQQEVEAQKMKSTVDRHERNINEMSSVTAKADQQVTMVEYFRDELGKWDVQRRTQEARVAEELAGMKQQLDAFRYDLERKESTLTGFGRNLDRIIADVNRLTGSQEQLRSYCEDRVDSHFKQQNAFRTELELKVMQLENRHNSLSDDLWGEQTGLAKMSGELNKANVHMASLTEEVKALQKGKASAEQLETLQADVKECLKDSVGTVSQLQQTVATVVQDVKDHFKTASNAIASHTASVISEVRSSYTDEIQQSEKLRSDVMKFMKETQENLEALEKDVEDSRKDTEHLVKVLGSDVGDLDKKRKRDKAQQEIENRQMKKKMGGIFENSDLLLRGFEHLAGVISLVVEGGKVSSAVSFQDDKDRKKVALVGYKDQQLPNSSSGGYVGAGTGATSVPSGGSTARKRLSITQTAQTDKEGGSVITIDNRCLSCSGQAATVLAGFKAACLQYQPGPVRYNQQTFSRSELLALQQQLLDQASEALQSGPDFRAHQLEAGAGSARNSTPSSAVSPAPAPAARQDSIVSARSSRGSLLPGLTSKVQILAAASGTPPVGLPGLKTR